VFPVVRVANVSRQRFGKHVPAEKNTHATIEIFLETGFSVGPFRDDITEIIGATKADPAWRRVRIPPAST
jgi:hypothetical protein